MRHTGIVLLALMLSVPQVSAADEPATQAPPAGEAPTPPPLPDYFFPDLGREALVHDGKYFLFKPIIAAVLDYTWFDQDDASLAQVGFQDNEGEFRAVRLGGTMRWQGNYKWELYATVDWQERKTREDAVFQLYDFRFRFPIGDKVNFDFGKMKEPIAYELSGLSVLLPQQERILLPFYPSRSIGLKFSGVLAGDRMTWAAGAFNDYLDAGTGYGSVGNDYVARITGLAWESPDQNSFVHFGLGYRDLGSDDGVIRFSGRPESNVADKYVDTGELPADRADAVSYELLLQHRQFSILGERIDSRLDSPETGDPSFSGWYAAGSWVFTGEARHYIRAGGYASPVVPRRRYGALELVAKYSEVDLTDAQVDGGMLEKWYLGLNWYTSTQWKVGVSWGDADLYKEGIVGNTKMLLLRMQWLWG
jgi:phosphate-selective porin